MCSLQIQTQHFPKKQLIFKKDKYFVLNPDFSSIIIINYDTDNIGPILLI